MTRKRFLFGVRPRQRGFAILMVVLVLVGLVIIGAPFAISMRQEELASINFDARTHAKLAATGALNLAKAQLERSHEYYERDEANAGASASPTIYNSPYVDSTGELRVSFSDQEQLGVDPASLSNPTGAMWSARAEDEQGKINVKSAPKALLRNILLEITGQTVTDPAALDTTTEATIAGEIVSYRSTHTITSLTQLRHASATLEALPDDQEEALYRRFIRFLTVYSAPFVSETTSLSVPQYPVNVNACSKEVLGALLRGIKLSAAAQPGVLAADLHKGVGYATQTLDLDGDGKAETYTDNLDELINRLRVFAHLAGTGVTAGCTSVTLDDASLFPPYVSPTVPPTDVDGYWISIEGDAVRYWKKDGATLSVTTNTDYLPTGAVDKDREVGDVPIEVRLLFTDIGHDLGGVLEALVTEKLLTPDSKAAILANAINPWNAAVLDRPTATGALCCHSFNIYTIEATGVTNAPDGRELARYTVKEVAQVAPSVDLDIRIDTQEDFQRPFYAALARRLSTWPNATQVSDVAPRASEPPDDPLRPYLIPHRGRLGLEPYLRNPKDPSRFALRFLGPLLSNVLQADTGGVPDPVKLLTTVKTDPGDDCDLRPEGLHVGVPNVQGATVPCTIAYPARVDNPPKDADGNPLDQNNIPIDTSYGEVRPFILSLWVKFDPKGTGAGQFNYGKDHFLFDLGHEGYSNRLALYYDATSDSAGGGGGGDLVLRVSDSTIQGLAAEVRYHIDDTTFQPERWYHVEAVVKGIHYNELALLVNGQCRGQYYPCATLSGTVAADAPSLPASQLVGADGTRTFLPFTWPQTGGAVFGAEIVNYSAVAGSTMAVPVGQRGARGSQPRAHAPGTRIELFGYDVRVINSDYDSLQPLTCIARSTAQLPHNLPSAFPDAKVDDADEKNLDGSTPSPVTADETDDYVTKASTSYTAASSVSAEYVVPTDNWLPVAASTQWLIKPVVELGDPVDIERTLRDREDFFKQVVDYTKTTPEGLLRLLCWTSQQLSVSGSRTVTDTTDGLGFFRLLKNPTDDIAADKQEIIKFNKAGVVLVWRYHPADGAKPEAERRMFAWYIGYVADLTRRCFDTGELEGGKPKAIVEEAVVRLDCVKVSTNEFFARGIRGQVTKTYDVPTTPPQQMTQIDSYSGHGIVEIRASAGAPFEWIRFTYPRYVPDATTGKPALNDAEETLCAHKFVVGISRAQQGKVMGADPVAQTFTAPAVAMPVFFVSSNRFSIGPADQVTVTDATGQRENRDIYHVNDYDPKYHDYRNRWFSFVQLPAGQFDYARNPRLLKFPSGSLPIAPDTCFYLGSDTTCVNGDPSQAYTEGGDDRRDDAANPEPERPANATFADVRITETSNNAARLWDWKNTGGAPDDAKNPRWASFGFDADAAPIPADLRPPFYVRLGYLERIAPRAGGDPPAFYEPYRFLGHVGWPASGYARINDECVFYRKLYYNRSGSHGAKVLLPNGSLPKDENGLAIALDEDDMTVYVDADQAKDFPQQGYIFIGNSVPSMSYWTQFLAIAGADPANQTALLDWLNQPGNPLIGPNGQPMSRFGGVSGEYMFYSSREPATVRGQEAVKLNLAYRACLNSTAQVVKVVDPNERPAWFYGGSGDMGSASVSLVGVEFLVLERGCLGTARDVHPVGSVMMPLDHAPTTLVPRKFVKLQRDETTGLLLRDTDGKIKALADNDSAFDIAKPQYEYGLPIEGHDGFPTEGYVQVGNEILGYCQDSDGLWEANVPASSTAPAETVQVLTGFKLFRQRYGTAKADCLESALAAVNPDDTVPAYYSDTNDFQTTDQTFWDRRVVRLIRPRFHDRYPRTGDEFGPHRDDVRIACWEFAYSLPGALWTQVKWREARFDQTVPDFVSDDSKPLTSDDPWDVQVMVQVDSAPAWDDTANDPATTKPVAQPVLWSDVPGRADVVYSPPGYRLKKPVIYLFDDPTANNYINATTAGGERGQYGDRIRLRVYFKYTDKAAVGSPPNYDIPWRTPWVDFITLKYKAPTHILEHKEMPY